MARISYGNSVRLSVCLSVLVSRPGTVPRPGKIEILGFYRIESLVFCDKISCPYVKRVPTNEGAKEGHPL